MKEQKWSRDVAVLFL